jgi:GTPase Era involved in 16S rRNA processing
MESELQIIEKVISILSRNAKCKDRYAPELKNFSERKGRAKYNRYRLGVIGVTSSGKSTMINSLLGEFLLPAVARPSSSQLVSCFRSKTRNATIYFENGKSQSFTNRLLTPKIIERYGDEAFNVKNKEKVKQIEISTPEFPFNENLILTDSPGLDAYGYEGHEQLTMNSLLPTIDFCIFLTTCKTNSDEKTLNVLNTVAEYDKPVIIVQNMIDSLQPSLDGKKTVADVAQDHRVRIERIVSRSNIKDKSKVHIVQISAINALQARIKKDKDLLSESNYKKLIEVVNTTFSQVRPMVEGNRLLILKKEITRIAKAAIEDGKGALLPTVKFEYDDISLDYENKKENCIAFLKNKLDYLQSQKSYISGKSSFDRDDISSIKTLSWECESEICKQMRILNSSIVDISNKLNVDSRSIISDFRFDKKPELRRETKKEKVNSGYWKKGERHWYTLWLIKDDDKWIDTSYEKEVTDVAKTRQNAIDYINGSIRVFKETIEKWQKSIVLTEQKIESEIENRRSEYKARIEKNLDSQDYLKIGKELQELAGSIITPSSRSSNTNSTKTDVKETCTFTIIDKCGLLPMAKLSDNIRLKIHRSVANTFINESYNYVIGWDENSESKFVKYAFGKDLISAKICNGANSIGRSITVIHKSNELKSLSSNTAKNVFVLVNAIQFGAAMSEIFKLKLGNIIRRMDRLYLVVQDFNEIMNGDCVSETLDNVLGLRNRKELNMRCSTSIMLLHDNPVYNMAAVEAQVTGCTQQYDEIRILNNLQTKFPYLFPKDKLIRNFSTSTIRIIIQKLGRI